MLPNKLLLVSILFISAALIMFGSIIIHNNYIQQIDPVLFVATIVFTVYSIMILLKEYFNHELVSPLSLYSFLMLIHFALPSLFVMMDVVDVAYAYNKDYFRPSLLFILISFALFHLGDIVASRLHGKALLKTQSVVDKWDSGRVVIVLTVMIAIAITARIYVISKGGYFQISRAVMGDLEGPFYATIMMAENLNYYAIIIACIYYFTVSDHKIDKNKWLRFIVIFVLAEFIYWLPTGRKENTILTLIIPYMIRYLITNRLPSKTILISLLLFIVLLFPTAHYYRSAMSIRENSTMSLTETIKESVSEGASLGKKEADFSSRLMMRLNLIEPVAATFRMIDNDLWDITYGNSYYSIFVIVIPRAIWPEKPSFNFGNEFGHYAGFLHYSDRKTAISLTYFGEAVLNFGWAGAVVFFAYGMFYGYFYRKARDMGSASILYYTVLLQVIMFIGGNFILYYGGLIKIFILMYALNYFMLNKKKAYKHTADEGIWAR